jgi:hypothetical protein
MKEPLDPSGSRGDWRIQERIPLVLKGTAVAVSSSKVDGKGITPF